MTANDTTNWIAGVTMTGAARLLDAEGLGNLRDEGIEGPAVSESGDSMRILLRFIGERRVRDSLESKRSKVEEPLGLGLPVEDGDGLPEWEEEEENFSGPELTLAMEDCIDNLDRPLRVYDDELANEIPVFCRVLDRWVLKVYAAGRFPSST